MSASDAGDGSSTGARLPSTWVLLRLPRFGGAKDTSDHTTKVLLVAWPNAGTARIIKFLGTGPHQKDFKFAGRLRAILLPNCPNPGSRSHRTCSDGQRKSCHRPTLSLSDPLFGPCEASRLRAYVRDERDRRSHAFHVEENATTASRRRNEG